MKSTTTVRRVVLSIIGVFIAMTVTVSMLGQTVSAAKASDYSLGVSPTSQTVNQGVPASYWITVSQINGWKTAVALTTSGVPAGALACFTPNPNPDGSGCITSTPTPSSVLLTITGAPMRSTPYTITVNGQSGNGSTKHSVDLTLTVNAPAIPASYSLSASPASVIVDAGKLALYSIAINRVGGFGGPVTLSASGLPPYATWAFSTSPTTPDSPTLTVTTDISKTPSGTFTLMISGTASPPQNLQSVQVLLVVSTAKGIPFRISGGIPAGGVGELAPGKAPTHINLGLENLNHKSISVTALSVAISSVTFGHGPASGCTAADFAVTQYSGPLPLTVPGDSTIHLEDESLYVPQTAWPTVQLKNSTSIQDGCKGAIVHLTYSGAANGN